MNQVLILIPARYESSRFPGKPLAKICGKPMIQHVYETCQSLGVDSFVVTDNDEIENCVKEFGKVIRVDDEVETGTQRIALAYERFFADKGYQFIVNVQGDEPLIEKRVLEKLIKTHQNVNRDIMTVIRKNSSIEDFNNPNIVKVATSSQGHCHYFSRASIPFHRGEEFEFFHQHVGLYSYTRESLRFYKESELSKNELKESLEQLRALDAGLSFGFIESKTKLIGVDVPEDIQKVEACLNGE